MKNMTFFLLSLWLLAGPAVYSEDAAQPEKALEAEPAAVEPEEDDDPAIDITTTDGRVYKDATVERVTPAGIDIGYLREDGAYAMVGIPLSRLTPELQQAFHYDPEKAKAFEAQLEQAKKKTMEEAAEGEAERMARVNREIRARLAGEEVQIKPADLRFAIYARRRPVAVIPVEQVRSGTVVAVIDDTSGLPALPTLVLIDRLKLSEGTGRWSGFLYPTGMHARYRDIERIPVFSDSLDEAQLLLERYLDIYSEFAAGQKEEESAQTAEAATDAAAAETPPDQAEAQQTAGIDNKGGNVPDNDYYDNVGIGDGYYYYDYPYCIGRSYWPVIWWTRHNNHGDWSPRPPRPRPPRPPRPRPPRPDTPPEQQPSKPVTTPIGSRPPAFGAGTPSNSSRPNTVRPSQKPSSGGTVSRPSRPYNLEQNGGFRRVVPKTTPARPATTPGATVERPRSLRSTPARPATWKGTPAPTRPAMPFRSGSPGGAHGRISGF